MRNDMSLFNVEIIKLYIKEETRLQVIKTLRIMISVIARVV